MRCLISDHEEMKNILKECKDAAKEIHDDDESEFNMDDFMMGVLAGYISAGYDEIKASLFVYDALYSLMED